ncbi:MAG: PDZ domain-containing protein [Planctomycetota bacterium]|nr:PDZ domain-containing protein [Planctomycetota bacterium]
MRFKAFLLSLLALTTPAFSQGAFLGVELDTRSARNATSPTAKGALILKVQEPSAASIMGLLENDRIMVMNEDPIENREHFQFLLNQRLPGEIVEFAIQRSGLDVSLLGVLGRRPSAQNESGRLRRSTPFQGFSMPEFPDFPEFPEFPEFNFSFPQDLRTGGKTVQLTYPESTPENERNVLTQEAIKQYGEGVEVRFEGKSTRIQIQSGNFFDIKRNTIPTPWQEGLLTPQNRIPKPSETDDDEL